MRQVFKHTGLTEVRIQYKNYSLNQINFFYIKKIVHAYAHVCSDM